MYQRELLSTKIPRKYQDLLEAEQQALGCENRVECMDKILGAYFGQKSIGAAGGQKPDQGVPTRDGSTPGSTPDTPKTLYGGRIYVIA